MQDLHDEQVQSSQYKRSGKGLGVLCCTLWTNKRNHQRTSFSACCWASTLILQKNPSSLIAVLLHQHGYSTAGHKVSLCKFLQEISTFIEWSIAIVCAVWSALGSTHTSGQKILFPDSLVRRLPFYLHHLMHLISLTAQCLPLWKALRRDAASK